MTTGKIKLTQSTINISKIKAIYNKPKKLLSGFNKTIRPHYCIEFIDGTFMTINKQEYKLLDSILEKH